MKKLSISSKQKREVIDLTLTISEHCDIQNGIIQINSLHTTTALTVADLDPGTDTDYLKAIEALIPQLNYTHPHNPSPEHVGSHLMSALIGTSLTLQVELGKIVLGTWQSIILIEFEGPRERTIVLTTIKS